MTTEMNERGYKIIRLRGMFTYVHPDESTQEPTEHSNSDWSRPKAALGNISNRAAVPVKTEGTKEVFV